MTELNFTFPRLPVCTEVTFYQTLEEMNLTGAMLIADSTVNRLHGERLNGNQLRVEIPGGETSKTPETLQLLWREMAAAGLRRDSTLIVVGGGTVCDVAGFAASTWKRGINLVLVPTTLLCMVDASLGGKTAVNVGSEKNQAGTVYPASRIMVCTEFLKTLPEQEILNGRAEALKTAVIGDREIADHLREGRIGNAVESSLKVKADIVSSDLEEAGIRKLLNLGHTAGHCIEAASKFKIPHGLAVAMGIPLAARMGGFHGFAAEFSVVAAELGINTEIPEWISPSKILTHLGADKKTSAAGRTWVIPRDWEDCVLREISEEEEKELLARSWE